MANDFANVAQEYGLLRDEDKALIAALIHKLTAIPIDDEPITEHEIAAIADMREDQKNGNMKILFP